jgi:hypothetical protein
VPFGVNIVERMEYGGGGEVIRYIRPYVSYVKEAIENDELN